MRIVKLYNIGDRVVLTDEWVKREYKQFLQFDKILTEPLTQEQKEDRLKTLKDTKEHAIGIVVKNELTQQFVQYAVEWDVIKGHERPPYAWFEEGEIKLCDE